MSKRSFLAGIAAKLSILMGGVVAVTSTQAAVISQITPPVPATEHLAVAKSKQTLLPKKITLRRQGADLKLVAHGSHASHSSHSSHSGW